MNTNSSTENASRENQIDLHRLMEMALRQVVLIRKFLLYIVKLV